MLHNNTPQYDLPGWSETRWLGCWGVDAEVGIYIHAGRFHGDLDLWWAQTVAYLPDGTIAADRSWGRPPDDRGVQTGTLMLRSVEAGERLEASFDGAVERRSVAVMARRPLGDGGSLTHLKFDVTAKAVRPIWDLHAAMGEQPDWAKGGHIQQHYAGAGWLEIGGERFRMDGPAYIDHSHGVRSWEGFGGSTFVSASFPDRGVMLIAVDTPEGEQAMVAGQIDDGVAPGNVIGFAGPPMGDLLGAPYSVELELATETGPVDLHVDVLHTFPQTITEANDNITGVDWDVAGDPLVLTECCARFTLSDGAVGFGHFERSVRRSRIDRESLSLRSEARAVD